MTTLFILFISIWFIGVSIFIYIFVKNDYDIEQTFATILRKKKKEISDTKTEIEVTNIKKNKNKTKELIGIKDEEIIEENPINETQREEDENEDCEKAGGLILNICDNNDYTEEEKILRAKILDKLKKNPTYFQEDGINKLIVPLEIMVFLNNDLNPLVSENGEIILSIEQTQNKSYIIKDKETNKEIFKSEEEQAEAIKELQSLAKEHGVPLSELKDTIKEKLNEKTEENKKSVESQNEKTIKEESEKTKREEEKKEITKQKNEETEKIIEDIGDDLIDEDLSDIEPTIKIEDIEETLGDELSELIEKEEKTEETIDKEQTIKDFLQKRKWQEGENMIVNWKEIKDVVINTFQNEVNLHAFLSNIIKQKPLITNDNKTAVFIDIKIINKAFAELYGADSEVLLKKLSRMPNKLSEMYQVGIELALSDYISDLITENKRMSTSYFTDGSKNFKGYGLWLKTDTFSLILNQEDFDFFRRYIYNDGLKMSVQSSNSIPLINDINGTVI